MDLIQNRLQNHLIKCSKCALHKDERNGYQPRSQGPRQWTDSSLSTPRPGQAALWEKVTPAQREVAQLAAAALPGSPPWILPGLPGMANSPPMPKGH